MVQFASSPLNAAAIQQLQEKLLGIALQPGDHDYDMVRANWNGTIDQYPAIIVRAEGIADVHNAVLFARDYDLPIGVRTTGHGAIVPANDALLLDLSRMRGISIDVARRIVRIQPGVTAHRLDHETQVFGLATVGPTIVSVSVAGFTLGGGFGSLTRLYGIAADNLSAVDLVLANGQIVRATADEYADLFWAVRGGGGNFGVAVSLEYHLHPIDAIFGGTLTFPIERAYEVTHVYQEWLTEIPDQLSNAMISFGRGANDQPALSLHLLYTGTLKEGEALMGPLRALGPISDTLAPMRYIDFQSMTIPAEAPGGFLEPGQQNFWYNSYAHELSDGFIDLLVRRSKDSTNLITHLDIVYVGNSAFRRVPEDAMAFSHRDANFLLSFRGIFRDSTRAAEAERSIELFEQELRPYATGSLCFNFVAYEGARRVPDAFSMGKWERLRELKTQYDPQNRFRLNPNIPPLASTR
jgi:FAD binding domain/Berberine and berberine like